MIEFVFATMLSLNLPGAASEHRLRSLAHDIAFVADVVDGAPFTGEARREAAALALVAVVVRESGLQQPVLDCRITGDRLPHHGPAQGRSISGYQLMRGWAWGGHTRAEICDSGPLAAWLALRVLRLHGGRCRSVMGWFQGYATGSCGKRARAAEKQCHLFETLAKRSGIAVRCWGKGGASFTARRL